jgi:uncharacterized RDD family membrane protein YckC
LASFARRGPRPQYRPEDGSYRATAAPFRRRVIAGLVDWSIVTVCYLVVNIPLGVFQATGSEVGGVVEWSVLVVTQLAALGVIAGYFAFFLSTGHTLGMRAVDIHVVDQRSGRSATVARATARGVLAVVFFISSFTAYTYVLGHYDEPLTDFQEVARTATISIASLALFGHLWQLRDRAGRSLWDRLTRLSVVEDIIPASMPDRLWSPWGT